VTDGGVKQALNTFYRHGSTSSSVYNMSSHTRHISSFIITSTCVAIFLHIKNVH
jgi:hypothetical protein